MASYYTTSVSASILERDHPPSEGGTLPRKTSFIINGGGRAVHHGLKAVAEIFPPHQKEKLVSSL